MLSDITNTMRYNWPSKQTIYSAINLGCQDLCYLGAAETLCSAVHDLYNIKVHDKKNTDLSQNLGSAILLGLCGYEFIPHTSKLGAAIVIGYSLYDSKTYLLSKPINKIITVAWTYLLEPIWNYTVVPVWKIVAKIADGIIALLKKTFNLSLPKRPVWFAVAGLGIAIPVYKFSPVLKQFFNKNVSTA